MTGSCDVRNSMRNGNRNPRNGNYDGIELTIKAADLTVMMMLMVRVLIFRMLIAVSLPCIMLTAVDAVFMQVHGKHESRHPGKPGNAEDGESMANQVTHSSNDEQPTDSVKSVRVSAILSILFLVYCYNC